MRTGRRRPDRNASACLFAVMCLAPICFGPIRAATAQAQVGSPSAPAGGPPFGSYLETCTRVEIRGGIMTALCRDRFGDDVEARVDTRKCRKIGNRNGQLGCE